MFVALFLLFFVPFFFAWYLNFTGFQPDLAVGGRLWQPPQPVPEGAGFYQTSSDDLLVFDRKWKMIYRSAADCDLACQDDIRLLSAVHLRLQKYAYLLKFLVWQPEAGALTTDAVDSANKLYVVKASDLAIDQWLRAEEDHVVWLVDPNDYVVLSYATPIEPKKVLKDLKKLLSSSH